jgi:hypothetical protein
VSKEIGADVFGVGSNLLTAMAAGLLGLLLTFLRTHLWQNTLVNFHPVLQIGSMNIGHFAFMGWLFDANLDDLQSNGD